MKLIIARLFFYWVTSFVCAMVVYYSLWAIMPNHHVFGVWTRMFVYHWEHPMAFAAIPCFFYGIFATVLNGAFSRANVSRRMLLTAGIILLTILISSPFGGMLWHYYDMKTGYFPSNWVEKMIRLGFEWGLSVGWLIVLLSIPYNILCSIGCYFLMKKGVELLRE